MRVLRLLSALAVISCQASCAVVQAPLKLASGMMSAVGRSLHLSSENTRKADDFNVESHDSKEAIVLNSPQAPEPEVAGQLIAQR